MACKLKGASDFYGLYLFYMLSLPKENGNGDQQRWRWSEHLTGTNTHTHIVRNGETVEAKLEKESEGAIGGAQRKEDRKKY